MKRILAAVLAVFVTAGLLGAAVIWLQTGDSSVVDPRAIPARASPAMQELLRSDAAGAAYLWWALSVAGVAICAALWLFLAYRNPAATPGQARSSGLSWLLVLLLALVVFGLASWAFFANPTPAPDWRMSLVIGGAVALIVAWWLATALGVKPAVTPSVPLAFLVRR